MSRFTVNDSTRRSGRQDGAARAWAVARQLVWGLSLALTCQAALAQAMYRIKPIVPLGICYLDGTGVIGLNGADEVAGRACNANGDAHA